MNRFVERPFSVRPFSRPARSVSLQTARQQTTGVDATTLDTREEFRADLTKRETSSAGSQVVIHPGSVTHVAETLERFQRFRFDRCAQPGGVRHVGALCVPPPIELCMEFDGE